MWGLVLAALIGGGLYLLGDPPESAFLNATSVLFWWYVVTSAIYLWIVGLVVLGITGVGAFAGGSRWGFGGGLLGAVAASGIGLVFMLLVAIVAGLRIMGAYFLHDSVVFTDGVYVWDTAKVIAGSVLIVLPLFLTSSNRSSARR